MSDITKALRQLREERSRTRNQLKRLEQAIIVLGKVVPGSGRRKNGTRARRKLSVAARSRIAEAQKARWAKWKSGQRRKAT
jgi:hypothetical protein